MNEQQLVKSFTFYVKHFQQKSLLTQVYTIKVLPQFQNAYKKLLTE